MLFVCGVHDKSSRYSMSDFQERILLGQFCPLSHVQSHSAVCVSILVHCVGRYVVADADMFGELWQCCKMML